MLNLVASAAGMAVENHALLFLVLNLLEPVIELRGRPECVGSFDMTHLELHRFADVDQLEINHAQIPGFQ